jgi:hypothetical protein
MLSLRKWFVPSKRNNYHPHALRTSGLVIAVVALLGINLSYNIVTAGTPQVLGYATNITSGDIISITNQQRASNGLGALATNAALNQAALSKAQDMFTKDYWAHCSPDGTCPWYFITAAGYSYTAAGENLAKDFDTSQGVVDAWMASPDHRANLLNSSYKDTGVAVMNGTLQGTPTTLVVAMYATPAYTPPPAAPATTPSAPASTTPRPTPTTTPATTDTSAPTSTPTPTSDQEAVKAKDTVPAATVQAGQPQSDTAKAADLHAQKERERRNWAQNASLYVITVLLLLTIMKHTVVWRTQRRGWKHIWLRTHPAFQYALLILAIVANLTSGVGVIR